VFLLKNVGSETLGVAATVTTAANAAGATFSLTSNAGFQVLPGQGAQVQVTAAIPPAANAGDVFSGALALATTDPVHPRVPIQLSATAMGATVAISGAGGPKVNLPSFPSTPVGSQSDEVFTIVNNGNGPAHVSVNQPAGGQSSDFSLVGATGALTVVAADLPAHGVLPIDVRYSPKTLPDGGPPPASSSPRRRNAGLLLRPR
jgi:hypothetical protein